MSNCSKYSPSNHVNEQVKHGRGTVYTGLKTTFPQHEYSVWEIYTWRASAQDMGQGVAGKGGPVSDVRRGMLVVGKATLDAVNPCG